MSGLTDKITGKAKQAGSRLTGDKSLHREGKVQETKGDVKQKAERARNSVEHHANKAADPDR